ncbi:MAG: O-antigen ligase family protein, partial [Actinobacteria bacterium]
MHKVAGRVALDRRVGLAAATLLVVLGGVGGGLALARAGGPAKLVGNAYDAFVSPERPTGQDLNSRLVNLSGSGRADYWRVAWREFTENPVLGGGAGSYERYWLRDRPNAFFARNAHNLYLEVLAELGPIGLLLLCVALGTPLVAAVRLRRRPL